MGLTQSLCGNRLHESPPLESYDINDDLFIDNVLPLPEAASSQSLCPKSYRARSTTVHRSSFSIPSSSYRGLSRRVKSFPNTNKQYFEDTDESSVETNSPVSVSYDRNHCAPRYHSKLQLHTRVPSPYYKPTTYSHHSSSYSSPSSSEKSPESDSRSLYYQETDHEVSGEEGFTPRRPLHRSYDDSSVRLWIPQTNSANFSSVRPPVIPHSRSQVCFSQSNLSTRQETHVIPHTQSHGSIYTAHSTSMENDLTCVQTYTHRYSQIPRLSRSQSTYSFDPSPSSSSLASLDEEEPLEELEETCATITPMCELASPENCPRTAFSFMRSISNGA